MPLQFDFRKMLEFLRLDFLRLLVLLIVGNCLMRGPMCAHAACHNPAKPTDYDYMITYVASIRRGVMHRSESEDHACSGAIIASNLILTTADCIKRVGAPWTRVIYVVVGSSMRASESLNSQYAEVKDARIHERYGKGGNFDNDIGVILLRTRLMLGCAANIVLLPTQNPGDATYSLVGWERYDGPYKDVLSIVPVRLADDEGCNEELSDISKKFCGAYINSTQTTRMCVTESGTPLIYNDHIYGLVTKNYDCHYHTTLYFTNVRHYLEWISDNGAESLCSTKTAIYLLLTILVLLRNLLLPP